MGIWHLYIATTFDGGNSYVTVDATPTIQSKSVRSAISALQAAKVTPQAAPTATCSTSWI